MVYTEYKSGLGFWMQRRPLERVLGGAGGRKCGRRAGARVDYLGLGCRGKQ